MEIPASSELKTFVPSRDFEQSKQFYLDLGFEMDWEGEKTVQFSVGDDKFLLQDYYVKEFAENFMMFLFVDDVDEWWDYIQKTGIKEKYQILLKPPHNYPWGMREIHLVDPTGVFWHFGKNLEDDT